MAEATVGKNGIDFRFFVVTMTTSMVLSFGAGIFFGGSDIVVPSPKAVKPSEILQIEYPAAGLSNIESPYADEPAGQHLSVDIRGVEAAFLDSEDRLAQALVDVAKASGLSMLSHKCQKTTTPNGVSCVGILLESHVSFHTWPEEGMISFDLFTCGTKSMALVMPEIEKIFAIGEDAKTSWSIEMRGFRLNENTTKSPVAHLSDKLDLGQWILQELDVDNKTEVYSAYTPFQRIDIWEEKHVDDTPSHEDAKKHNLQPGDPRWLTNELVEPERFLFLDGTMVLTEFEYYEALVHPVMFTHPNPRRVAIIGEGVGANMAEVLVHNTVESVVVIQPDKTLTELANKYFHDFNNCTEYIGISDFCNQDEKVTMIYEDGYKWLMDRYGNTATKKFDSKFDVVILDVDTDSEKFSDTNFISSILSGLTDDGILVTQIGPAPTIHDPRADMGVFSDRERFITSIEKNPMAAALLVYEEPNCGKFYEPQSFLAVCKNVNCRSRWLRDDNAAHDYDIHARTVPTTNNKLPYRHFDGTTMQMYRAPSKAWETVYCLREPTPFECNYASLDTSKEIHDYDSDAKKSSFKIVYKNDEVSIDGVLATVDIPKGSYIMPNHLASSLIIDHESLGGLRKLSGGVDDGKVVEELITFIDKNGRESSVEGVTKSYVEVGASSLIEEAEKEEDANVVRWMPRRKRPAYSPVYDRHYLDFDLFLVAKKNIKKGERLIRPKNI